MESISQSWRYYTKAVRLVRIVDFIERATSACRLSSLCRVSAIACSSVGVPKPFRGRSCSLWLIAISTFLIRSSIFDQSSSSASFESIRHRHPLIRLTPLHLDRTEHEFIDAWGGSLRVTIICYRFWQRFSQRA